MDDGVLGRLDLPRDRRWSAGRPLRGVLVVLVTLALAGCTPGMPSGPVPVSSIPVPVPVPVSTAPASAGPVSSSPAGSTTPAALSVLVQDTSITEPGGVAAPVQAGTVTADRKDFGYVGALLTGPDGTVLRLDRTVIVTNEQLAAEGKPSVPNNYEVVDDNPLLRDYPVAADVLVRLNGTSAELHAATLDDLAAVFTSSFSGQPEVLVDVTYDAGGTVTEIDQHFRP